MMLNLNPFPILLWLYFLLDIDRSEVFAQSFHKRDSGNEIHEIRIYETAPPGTKATLNEAFDRLLREQKNCFAQFEANDPDLDWIEFDSALLMFMTTSDVPSSAKTTQQAMLHLMCSSNKMRTIHFSIHVTRRNRHPPKFSLDNYHFYAPANLQPGYEVGRVQVVDHDPIIYNSQIQLTIVRPLQSGSGSSSPAVFMKNRVDKNGQKQSAAEIDAHWQVFKNGSVNVAQLMTDLQLYRPYTLKLLAVDFGSPQLYSTANVTIVAVSVSQPRNLRVNVANTEYQIFEWDSPAFGIPEKYRLTIRRQAIVLYTQDVDANENIAMSKMHFQSGPEYTATITAVDVDGESPSEPHKFILINTELQCDGECSPRGGIPMCYYGKFHKIEQYRDINGLHCLCYDGFSSAQCDTIESCAGERSIEAYGGVDWPFTPVNQSSSILCPYNANGELIKRQCVWDGRLDIARWENVSNNELCKKQSSILVHLGVLANFAQRNDQTVSGFRAVQKFLDNVLQFPSFNPNISTAHFDSKIAEHVAQVIDGIATRNLSLVSGNTTEIREALVAYTKEFSKRLPVPFDLRSLGEGLLMKTWHWTGREEEKIGGNGVGKEEPDDGNQPVQLGRRCYVHLPSPPNQAETSSIQGNSQIVRVSCLKSSTLFPLLDGRSPVLFVDVDSEDNGLGLADRNSESESMKGRKGLMKSLPESTKALIGLRPEVSSGMRIGEPFNYTCAFYDENERTWSITGITVLSRNFENGFILCESTHLSVFALLPESMFTSKKLSGLESVVIIFPIATASIAIVVTIFLLLSAVFQRTRYIDPALVLFLLTILLVHIIHLLVLVAPHFWTNPLKQVDYLIYLVLQYALISVAALVALLNSAIHTRISAIEVDSIKVFSRMSRLIGTCLMGVVCPLCLCALTWLLEGYIFYGVTTRNPSIQPFNWVFVITFLLPLVVFVGSAIGYGCYSLYYGNSLAKQHSQTSIVMLTNSDASKKVVLLRDLANAAGLSLLVLLLFYAEGLIFYQKYNVTRSMILALLHISLTFAVFLFVGYLYRIELKFPRFSHHFNAVDPHRNGGSNAFTAVSAQLDTNEAMPNKENALNQPNGSTFKSPNGYANPRHSHQINSPSESEGLSDPNLDRKVLLDHCHHPSMVSSMINPPSSARQHIQMPQGAVSTMQLRARNNSIVGDHILSRHSFLAYKDGADYGASLRRCSQPVALFSAPSTNNSDYYGILSARQYAAIPKTHQHSHANGALLNTQGGYRTSAVQRQDALARMNFLYTNGTSATNGESLNGVGSVLESDDLLSQSSPATNTTTGTNTSNGVDNTIPPLSAGLMKKFLQRSSIEESFDAKAPPPPSPIPTTNGKRRSVRLIKATFADEEEDLAEDEIIDENEINRKLIGKRELEARRKDSLASASSAEELSHPLVSVV